MGGARGIKLAGIALMVLGVLIAFAGDSEENPGPAFLGVAVMVLGVVVHFRGRRHAAREAAPAVLGDDKPDVLYLRAFRADTSTLGGMVMAGLTTDEEQLAQAVRPIGDLVAIGRPGESLPPPGGARVYLPDSEWRAAVTAQMRAAPLVILRAGVGEGLLWELERSVREVSPQRLLIFVFNLSASEYDSFRAQTQARLGLGLPRIERYGLLATMFDVRRNPSKVRSGFIRFSDGWQPAFLPLAHRWIRIGVNDDRKALRQALRPVFEEQGRRWQPLGRWGSG